MRSRWLLRLGAVSVYLVVLFAVVGSRLAVGETWAAGVVLQGAGERRVSPQAAVMLVWPAHGLNFLLRVSWSCSSAPILAGVAVVALVLSTAVWWRRVAALAAASILVVAVNVLRLAGSAVAAAHWGPSGMLVFHDWAGTAASLVTGAAAIWLCLRAAGRRPPAPVGGA
jgi:exosortase/archaeosortase family protein